MSSSRDCSGHQWLRLLLQRRRVDESSIDAFNQRMTDSHTSIDHRLNAEYNDERIGGLPGMERTDCTRQLKFDGWRRT